MKCAVLMVFLLFFVLVGSQVVMGQTSAAQFQVAEVTNIVDGNTIDVLLPDKTIHRVRYIGIDAPESGEPCGREATAANTALVTGRTVALYLDASNTDQNGYLLRYVFVGGTFVNAELVANGWAEPVRTPPNTTFADWFEYLGKAAQDANLGCYALGGFRSTSEQENAVTVRADVQVNLRSGPGTNYPLEGTLPPGQTVSAAARNAAGDWLVLDSGAWVAAWVVTVTGDVNTLPVRAAPPPPAAQQPQQPQQPSRPSSGGQSPAVQPTQAPAPPAPPAPAYTCDCSKTCGAMSSCEEAYFQLNQCGCSRRDGDGDGVPCEEICPGG
jgi:endonuclease YncB( thermonuclease family)